MIYIIIPCKGRLAHLKQCLEAIIKSNFDNYKVIVADYNCPEGAADYVNLLDDKKIKAVKAKVEPGEWNMSAAFNEGFKAAKPKAKDLILFIGADAILQPDFLTFAVSAIT